MSGIFNRAYKWNVVTENVCKRCELPKVRKDDGLHTFTIEETQRFINEALHVEYSFVHKGHTRTLKATGQEYTVPDYIERSRVSLQFVALFNVLLYGGMRRGEVIALKWKDIDFDNHQIDINKSASKTKAAGQIIKEPKTRAGYRKVTLPGSCFDLLRSWKMEQKALSLKLGTYWKGNRRDFDENFVFIKVFIKDDGSCMNLDTPSHKFREICYNYNRYCDEQSKPEKKLPEIRLHDLRHTNATMLITKHVDIRTVANRLGHSRTSVTLDVYSEALESADREASDTLEKLFRQA